MKAYVFHRGKIVLQAPGNLVPSVEAAQPWIDARTWFEVTGSGRAALAAELDAGASPPPNTVSVSMRHALSLLESDELALALKAAHLARWRRTSCFCGACGARTEEAAGGKAFRCTDCGHLAFPKVSPAIIVQVSRGGEILLGRSTRHPPGSYSVLAGFVDPAESLEEAVHREVMEEAGISVRHVRYFGSQPWPFPDSLMVGFTAEYAGGEIRCDDEEMEDVQWFPAGGLPPVPPSYSIARTLIDDFAVRNGVDPASVPTWTPPGQSKR